MRTILSSFLPLSELLNISNHQESLRAISGNSTDCDEAQLAYAECFWCADDENRCFSEENPPSCQVPDKIDGRIDFNSMCKYIDNHLTQDLFDGSPAYFNLSLHVDSLLFKANNTFCDYAHQAYHKCRWCHQREYEPGLCFESIGLPCQSEAVIPEDYVLPPLWSRLGLNLSDKDGLENCDQVYDLWSDNRVFSYDIDTCYGDIWVHRQCRERFCEFVPDRPNEINKDYLGATTLSQKRALVWLSRVAACLSFGGACYVIWSIFSNVKRQKSVYYHLLFGMAIFDIVTAATWVFATAPLPEDAHHVYGANGTNVTCKTQAFLVQLGFTSVFYNVSLAVYYVMVVAYNRKEFQLKAIQFYLHGFPLLIGMGLALGAIHKYHWIDYGCHILPYSPKHNEGELWPVLVFVALPLGFSIVAITAAMLVVYWKVRRQSSRAKKWQLSKGSLNELESQVFWQCVYYVLAFYITWPILFSVYLASVDTEGPLGLTLTVAFFAPLQGFNNFLVFVRPKMIRVARELWPSFFGVTKRTSQQQDNAQPKPAVEVAERSNDKPRAKGPEDGDSPPKPASESLDELSNHENCVVHFLDGTSQPLQDVDTDMDPSALLPLTKDSTGGADNSLPFAAPELKSTKGAV